MFGNRAGLLLPEPDELESLSRELLEVMFKSPLPAQRFGRSGQAQHGIDVILRAGDGRWIAAQCKRYLTKKLTAKDFAKEVEAAHEIDPPLQALIFVTTLRRDGKLIATANQAKLHGQNSVQIWFEEDLKEYLEQHGFGHRFFDSVPTKVVRAILEHRTGESSPIGASAASPTSAPRSALAKEGYGLLDGGRPHSALALLDRSSVLDGDESEIALLRARALFAAGDFAGSTAVAEQTPDPAADLLAVSGIAAARLGDHRRSSQLLAKATAAADSNSRGYVTAINVLVSATADASLSYEELLDRVPDSLRTLPDVARVLGDVAMERERYAEAVDWFERSAAGAAPNSSMRTLSIGTARIALAVQQLPGNWRNGRDDFDRAVAERGRAELEYLRLSANSMESVPARQALLSNLAIANSILGHVDECMLRAREAIEVDAADIEMWQRWLRLVLRHDVPVEMGAIEREAPADPEIGLLVGLLQLRAECPDDARTWFESVLTNPLALDAQRDRARYGLLRLDHPGELPEAVLESVLADLGTATSMATQFLIEHLRDPNLHERASAIARQVAEAADLHLECEEKATIAALLRDQRHGLEAAALLPSLRTAAQLDGRVNPGVADVLIDVLLANRRLVEADACSLSWLQKQPNEIGALANRSAVLHARGQLDEAWQLQASAVEAGLAVKSVWLLEQFAQLSHALCRLRQARRLVAKQALPTPRTPSSFRGLVAALTRLRDTRVDEVIAAGATQSMIDAGTSGAMVHLAIRQRQQTPTIKVDTAVRLKDIRTGDERFLWLGGTGAGLHGAAGVAFDEPWFAPARGKSIGDLVTFEQGPFAGQTYTVHAIRQPQQLLFEQAAAVGIVAGLNEGGLESISHSNPDEAVESLRRKLEEKGEHTQRRLAFAQSLGLPATAAAEMFGVSPREFLQRSRDWKPVSGQGTFEDVQADEAALFAADRHVLDPVTLLLLVTLEAEALAGALPARFVITPQTKATLQQWYLQERESARARALAYLGPKGNLQFREYGIADRKSQWHFWRRVRDFVSNSCEVIEAADDELGARGAPLEDIVDAGTLSSIALCGQHGWALVAEEAGTRGTARLLGADRTTPLQRLIALAGEQRVVRRELCVEWLAGLIERGWSFVVLPFWVFVEAAGMSTPRRKPMIEALLQGIKTADPRKAAIAILGFLVTMERLRVERNETSVDSKWLWATAFRSLPPSDPAFHSALRRLSNKLAPGRPYRALRHAFSDWTKRATALAKLQAASSQKSPEASRGQPVDATVMPKVDPEDAA